MPQGFSGLAVLIVEHVIIEQEVLCVCELGQAG